jgi:hypothetical protein
LAPKHVIASERHRPEPIRATIFPAIIPAVPVPSTRRIRTSATQNQMTSLLAVVLVLVGTFAASLVVERTLGRSHKEMVKPGWYYVFFTTFIPFLILVYNVVSVHSSLLYAAYALSGGVAALAAQCFYGAKTEHRS